ncbi:MAG: flagellar hook-length control protein FliK [Candidatus Igneacidithiobacillus chanchocoensis]
MTVVSSSLPPVALESNADAGKPVATKGGQSFGQVLARQVNGKGASQEPLPETTSLSSEAASAQHEADRKETMTTSPTSPAEGNVALGATPSASTALCPGLRDVKGAAANRGEDSYSADAEQALRATKIAASSPKKAMGDFAETEMVAVSGASSVTPTVLPQQPSKPVVTTTDAKPEPKKTRTDGAAAATPPTPWTAPLPPVLATPEQSMLPIKTAPSSSPANLPPQSSDAAAQAKSVATVADASHDGKASGAAPEKVVAGAQPLVLDAMPSVPTAPHLDSAPLFSAVLQQAALGGAVPPKAKGADVVPGTPILGAMLPLGANAPAAPTAPSAQLQLSPAVQEQPAWGNALGQSVQWMAEGGVQQALIHLHPQHLGPLVVQLNVSQNGQAAAVFLSDHPEVRAAISAALPQLQQSFAALGLNLTQSNVGSGGSGSASNRRQSADRDADAPGAIEEISSLRSAASGQIHRGLLSTFV